MITDLDLANKMIGIMAEKIIELTKMAGGSEIIFPYSKELIIENCRLEALK